MITYFYEEKRLQELGCASIISSHLTLNFSTKLKMREISSVGICNKTAPNQDSEKYLFFSGRLYQKEAYLGNPAAYIAYSISSPLSP
ncbi:hypothetical protein CEXT_331731 [Caerostris extrusa]|uniref:Uncharacterized protein n=1 Tax=Caerostris extrusa TaxID=172846 RepID=A0AAV4TKY7_CAEEX|nr:hypothetical protein CEXT_331731 [Caerostris extrusa]